MRSIEAPVVWPVASPVSSQGFAWSMSKMNCIEQDRGTGRLMRRLPAQPSPEHVGLQV